MTDQLTYFSVQEMDGITLVSIHDGLTYEQAITMLEHLAARDIYHFRCIDISAIRISLTKDEVTAMAAHSKSIFKEPNRSAIIAGDDLSYGIIRSLIVYREEDAHMQMNVFRDVKSGIIWLNKQKELLKGLNQD